MTNDTGQKDKVKRGRRRILKGRVVSTKMGKTVVVRVERKKRHPLYLKVVKLAKKYHVHDEHGKAKDGDFVSIIESKPVSKTKRWCVKEVIERAK